MGYRIDIAGNVYGRLTVLSFDGTNKRGSQWNCLCNCGNTLVVSVTNLKSGNTKSCGCLKIETTSRVMTKHSMSGTSEYHSWYDMKRRCLDPRNDHYNDYAGRGISVHKDFVDSFSLWYEEIGVKPLDGERWSVGRIDNNGWYTYDNIRWELDTTQARNHSKQINNTSGVVGVHKNKNCWVAQWETLVGKKKQKSFSCNKYGEDEAKTLAIAYRLEMIKELNRQGAGYADSHGKDK